MARTASLIRRGNRWYYNRAYPKDVWPVVGKSPFRLSLQTDTLETAQRRRPEAERQYWAAVDAARETLSTKQPTPFGRFDAEALAARWYREQWEWRLANVEEASSPTLDIDQAIELIDDRSASLREALSQSEYGEVRPLAEGLLSAAGYAVDRRSAGYLELLRLLLRAELSLLQMARARHLGDYGTVPSDPMFGTPARQVATSPRRTLQELLDAHKADKVANRAPSTQAAYEPVWRVLTSVLGPHRDLEAIRREQGRELFAVVQRLPRSLAKHPQLASLPLMTAIERAEELGIPKIAPKTVNGSYMGFISAIFGWAVKEQWMAANPVQGLAVVDPVADADKRDPFTDAQLEQIFRGPPWMPRDECPRGRPLHFWGPLIALFQGLRRGEIAQLEVADIGAIDGLPVIMVRDGGRKRLKTDNARRTLPVHAELLKMGFLRFVEAQRATGEIRLFEGETPDSRGQWGDGLSDWFLRLLRDRGITGRKLGMHSFRHNYEDRLREAGLHGTAMGQELTGRSRRNDTSSAYGSGFAARALADATSKIVYPSVDLGHLYLEPQGS